MGSQIIVRPTTAKGLPPAAAPGMHFREMIWGVASKRDLAAIHKEIAKDREVTVDADGTIRCIDPCNLAVGFRVWKQKSKVKAPRAQINGFDNIERIDQRAPIYDRASPIRLGYIGFILPDITAAEAFYHGRLGFPISDRYAGGAAVFMRCAPEEDHHNLFLINSRGGPTKFHHVAFEVRDIHELFAGGIHFDHQGWETEVGPGRHPVSSAYFWYFKSPCEGSVEYYTDSDHATKEWKPTAFRTNRFSEWHLVDGIRQGDDGMVRPSMAADRRQ